LLASEALGGVPCNPNCRTERYRGLAKLVDAQHSRCCKTAPPLPHSRPTLRGTGDKRPAYKHAPRKESNFLVRIRGPLPLILSSAGLVRRGAHCLKCETLGEMLSGKSTDW